MESLTPVESDATPMVDRLRDPAQRNLVITVLVTALTLLVLAPAFFLSWSHALVALLAACSALGVISVLWRLGLHRQPNGVALSLSLVALAGSVIPMTYGMVTFLRQHKEPTRTVAAAPVVATSAPSPATAGIPLFRNKFKPAAIDPTREPHAKFLADTRVRVGDQSYLIEKGEAYPLGSATGEDVVILAGAESITLSAKKVEVVKPQPAEAAREPKLVESPAQIAARAAKTRAAQEQAIRMYPALKIKDSRENKAFIAAYERMRETNPGFLEDPEWPLQLTRALAESSGWVREDQQTRR